MNISKKVKKRKTEYFNPARSHTCHELGNRIVELIHDMEGYGKDIIVICIGTDRATGDALGPLVGDYILAHDTAYQVAGTLEYPVHALNIRDTIDHIYEDFDDPFVIAVDASLGMSKDMGMVTITNSHLFPGKGVNKKLPAICLLPESLISPGMPEQIYSRIPDYIQLNRWPNTLEEHSSMPIIICHLLYKL